MITIPVKNPISVYNTLMKPILEKEGFWEQFRTDQGGEFVLSTTVQHHLAHLRPRQARMPVIQSTSRTNHRVERLWPEVNSRIKFCFMDYNQCNTTKYGKLYCIMECTYNSWKERRNTQCVNIPRWSNQHCIMAACLKSTLLAKTLCKAIHICKNYKNVTSI